VNVVGQPTDGVVRVRGEHSYFKHVNVYGARRYGFWEHPGDSLANINHYSINCRAQACGSDGLRLQGVLHSTYKHFQGLQNRGHQIHLSDNCRNVVFEEPDCEYGDVGLYTTSVRGLQVRGGYFGNLRQGMRLSGEGLVVDAPHFSRTISGLNVRIVNVRRSRMWFWMIDPKIVFSHDNDQNDIRVNGMAVGG
jgi:hypothetical protein